MKNMINRTHIEGWLYDHSLELKTSGPTSKNPGTPFISGEIQIATDDAQTNVVPVHFTYVTEKTAKGNVNQTFTLLNDIINEKYHSIIKHDAASAVKLRIDSAIGLNDFYTDRNGEEEAVSVKRNEGGFVHLATDLAEDEKVRSTFEADMLITNVTRMEANEERQIPERVIVRGAIFDFRKSLLPLEFTATNPNAMNYFEGLGASAKEPVFTKVWGRQISETIVRTFTEESAFGEDSVREVRSSRKDFVITGAAREPYAWDDTETITAAELTEAMQNREVYLASVKQRWLDWKSSQNGSNGGNSTPVGGFHF